MTLEEFYQHPDYKLMNDYHRSQSMEAIKEVANQPPKTLEECMDQVAALREARNKNVRKGAQIY